MDKKCQKLTKMDKKRRKFIEDDEKLFLKWMKIDRNHGENQ